MLVIILWGMGWLWSYSCIPLAMANKRIVSFELNWKSSSGSDCVDRIRFIHHHHGPTKHLHPNDDIVISYLRTGEPLQCADCCGQRLCLFACLLLAWAWWWKMNFPISLLNLPDWSDSFGCECIQITFAQVQVCSSDYTILDFLVAIECNRSMAMLPAKSDMIRFRLLPVISGRLLHWLFGWCDYKLADIHGACTPGRMTSR